MWETHVQKLHVMNVRDMIDIEHNTYAHNLQSGFMAHSPISAHVLHFSSSSTHTDDATAFSLSSSSPSCKGTQVPQLRGHCANIKLGLFKHSPSLAHWEHEAWLSWHGSMKSSGSWRCGVAIGVDVVHWSSESLQDCCCRQRLRYGRVSNTANSLIKESIVVVRLAWLRCYMKAVHFMLYVG